MRYLLIACLITGCSAGAPTMSDDAVRQEFFSIVQKNMTAELGPSVAGCAVGRLGLTMTTSDIKDEIRYQAANGKSSAKTTSLLYAAAKLCGI